MELTNSMVLIIAGVLLGLGIVFFIMFRYSDGYWFVFGLLAFYFIALAFIVLSFGQRQLHAKEEAMAEEQILTRLETAVENEYTIIANGTELGSLSPEVLEELAEKYDLIFDDDKRQVVLMPKGE